MRLAISILVLVGTCMFAEAGQARTRPILSFSLNATNEIFQKQIAANLKLCAKRDEMGWEVGVFKGRSTDNLLYPQRSWHGAFPCQLAAWSHHALTFPDERVIPVRGLGKSIRIHLIDPVVSVEGRNHKFTKGRVEISWDSGN